MEKFRFTLQGVLDIKEKLEEQAKSAFGAARARLTAEEDKRDAILKRLSDYREQLAGLMEGDIDLCKIRRCEEAIDVIGEQLDAQKMVVRRAEKQLELARTKLNTAMAERKTLDKLKEKQFEEYKQEYDREERKQIDELVSYRHSLPNVSN